MTEANQVRVALREHLSPFLRLTRIESSTTGSGIPDYHYTSRGVGKYPPGVSGWIEGKLLDVAGRPNHLTMDQVVWGEEEAACGGRWFLLGKMGTNRWRLYSAAGARALYEGVSGRWLLDATVVGFPTRAVLDKLVL